MSILVFAAIYGIAVLTSQGQAFENAALAGSRLEAPAFITEADDELAAISYTSLAVSIVVVFLIGLIRRRPRLAIAGAGTIIVSVLAAEAFKRIILPRPALVQAAADISHNSFPSGHTTIAMSILMATILVVPYRGRGWAMFIVFTWSTGIGAATLAAHWHRLSDTIGGDMIALGVGSLFSLWLARSGDIVPWRGKSFPFRTALVVFIALFAAVTLALALAFAYFLPTLSGADYQSGAYQVTYVAASAASTMTGLVFWWSWHRLQVPAKS